MRSASDPVRFLLLGGARVLGEHGVPRLERRTAAIVALIAFERQLPRSKVAGLLWPDSKERTARNNLAQALRRLRAATGVSVIVGDEVLELRGATSDVGDLLASDDAKLESGPFRDLLGGYDFDDLPELEAWLRGARAAVARAWARAAAEASARHEEEGELEEALAWAEAHLAADPISEQAHLRIARLHLTVGDAPAAMRAYERCKTTLARELGMMPSPSMLDVLKAIRAGAPRRTKRGSEGPSIPASVLRPPRVGRRVEWGRLDGAAADGSGVILVGEPGIGKSRLARDWASERGAFAWVEGRPGDRGVPFSTLSRALRLCLPRIEAKLPSWTRRELARLLPELEEAPSRTHDSSKLRLFDAITRAFAEVAAIGAKTLVIDDFQWVDGASGEACLWLFTRTDETGLFPILAHRRGELEPEVASQVEQVVEANAVLRLELDPLSASDTLELIASLGVKELEGRAAELARSSGGYPLYVLELVRSMLRAAETVPTGGGERSPISDRMRALFRRRLEGLSADATRLARIASVAGTDFDVDLAAAVLEVSPIDLADAWSELETCEVLRGAVFTHDVLADVVREMLPPLVRSHTHGRIAAHLTAKDAEPARIADHLLAANRGADAVPHLLRAAESALALSCLTDAVRRWEDAARIMEEGGDPAAASRALYLRGRALLGPQGRAVVERLERLAATPLERARASFTRARAALEVGDLETAEAAGEEAADLARGVGDARVAAEAIEAVFEARLRQGHLARAEETLAAFEAANASFGDRWIAIALTYQRAQLAAARSQHRAALRGFEEAMVALEAWGEIQTLRARGFGMMAHSHVAIGEIDAAAEALSRVDAKTIDPHLAHTRAVYETARARVALARGEHAVARRALDGAVSAMTPRMWIVVARLVRAELAVEMEEPDEARRTLRSVLRDAHVDPTLRARAAVLRARLAVSAWTSIAPADAELVAEHGAPEAQIELACLRALGAPESRALSLLDDAGRGCEALDLSPLTALHAACAAEVARRGGRVDEARAHVERARATMTRAGAPRGWIASVVLRRVESGDAPPTYRASGSTSARRNPEG